MRVTIQPRETGSWGAAGYYVVIKQGGRPVTCWGPYTTMREAKAALAALLEQHGSLPGIVEALQR